MIEKHSDYGYLVELNGVRRNVHADKLRPFHIRVDELICDLNTSSFQHADCGINFSGDSNIASNSVSVKKCAITVINSENTKCECAFDFHCCGCSVIFDRDDDFGHIQAVETPLDSVVSLVDDSLLPSELPIRHTRENLSFNPHFHTTSFVGS